MALANIAVLLAQWKYKVLIVDWDLEAPGLEYFFKDYIKLDVASQQMGIIDLLDNLSNKKSIKTPTWSDILIKISIPNIKGTLHFLTAGKKNEEYFYKIRNLDVDTLYAEINGGNFVESLRNEWKKEYDFVLIDSRTGITDIGGICTIQLPDMLILFFTATDQGLDGVIDVAEKAAIARQRLPVERLGLISIPIPSRFDTSEEFNISKDWLDRFASKLSAIYDYWLPEFVNKHNILKITKIPYVPYFSFGEKLPILEDGTKDPSSIGYSYENLAALIANNLESVGDLINNRDQYLMSAKRSIKSKSTVSIIYSYKDESWNNRLVSHLGVLQQDDFLDLWDDRRIGAGDDWYQEIQEAIGTASVAILLVSADFLTSKFILNTEIPRLLKRREKEGMRIFPIIVEPCAWKQVKWLSRMNLRPKDGKPLSGGNEYQIKTDLAAIGEEVTTIIEHVSEDSNKKVYDGPEKISLARLPSTSSNLFGRDKELQILDEAWVDQNTNIVTLVAFGGMGKTAIVNAWLNQMRDDNFGGAEHVFGWSFYSQGASEGKQVSADVFMASALDWFGDLGPDKGSPWDKGERLAELIKNQKTLLILDGLEPLQNPPGEGGGRIKDPSLQSLLRELANHNPGLCVITTRLEVDDIKDFIGNSTQNISLDRLSPDAGIELLKHLGVKGTSEELKQASSEFGNHALALTLLGSYLNVVYDGDVRKRDRIARLTDEEEHGGHAKRVMESYEEWFKGKPELNILYIMGVFGRLAEGSAIKVLIAKPVINGLTSNFKKLSYKNWRIALNRFRKVGLLSNEDTLEPDKLDCHPLIQEYFGEKLKKNNLNAWKEGHSRLYDYYKKHAKEFPETLEEMKPLYAAVRHGCEAGRHQEAFEEVYWRRIRRGRKQFSTSKLGAFGSELAALSCFFDSLWSQPVDELTEADQSFILNEAGFDLRALGRLAESAQPMQAGMDADVLRKDLENVARDASNFSELHLTMGNVTSALDYARQSVEYADRSGDAFMRIISRTTMANALHQAGRQSESEAAFVEAEEMQKKHQPEYSYLYSLQGFQYCDLLLSQRKYRDVLSRAGQTLEWIKKEPHTPLLTIAVDHLSIGCAHLLQTQEGGSNDFAWAETHLNQAMDKLRKAGRQDILPLGLLARAELYRVQGAFEKVQHDLNEAMTISERGGMGLHKADCHLEYARLYLAMGEKGEDACRNLETAKEMIGKMGYHRRDTDVREIEEKLL